MTQQRFDDKVVIVTGAAGGIGEVYARRLADEGARVVVADRDPHPDPEVRSVVGDLCDPGVRDAAVTPEVTTLASCASMAASAWAAVLPGRGWTRA